MLSQMTAMEEENRRLKRIYADLSMQADLLKESLENKQTGHPLPPSHTSKHVLPEAGRQMRAFGRGSTPRDGRDCGGATQRQHSAGLPDLWGSETCYRYGPKLRAENEETANLLTGLTDARKTWGFGLCFLHLRNVKGRASAAIGSRQWRGRGTTNGSAGSTASLN